MFVIYDLLCRKKKERNDTIKSYSCEHKRSHSRQATAAVIADCREKKTGGLVSCIQFLWNFSISNLALSRYLANCKFLYALIMFKVAADQIVFCLTIIGSFHNGASRVRGDS